MKKTLRYVFVAREQGISTEDFPRKFDLICDIMIEALTGQWYLARKSGDEAQMAATKAQIVEVERDKLDWLNEYLG